jgi:hypothetical protein
MAFVAAVVVSARAGDPNLFPAQAGDQGVEIIIVNNGYHSGLVLPRASVASLAVAQGYDAVAAVTRLFAAYEWLKVGWGGGAVLPRGPHNRPTELAISFERFFGQNNEAVLHVVGLSDEPHKVFRGAQRVPASDHKARR